MIGNLLNIGILGFVGLACSLALIQNFKGNLALQRRCRRLRNYPGRIKLLNGFQTGHHRRFQSRRRKDNEIMGKCWIAGFLAGKVKIQINKRCHQVGFTCTHRKAKEIVSIRNTIKGFSENPLIIDTFGILRNLLLQFRGYLFTCIIFQGCILQERSSSFLSLQELSCTLCYCEIIEVQGIKCALTKQPLQRLAIAGNLQV